MKKIILSCLFAFALASCDDLTERNVDPKATETVPYTILFSNAQVELVDLMTSTNVNLNIFRMLAQHWTQVTYLDESNYDLNTRSIPDNFWDGVYLDVLRDLLEAERLIEDVDEVYLGAAQRANEKAAIDVLQVYAWSVLIQIYGDVPYGESLDIQNLLPAYTNDSEIYADLLSRLDADITALSANTDAPTFPGSDLLYGGDSELWLRFANSLKLKLGMLVAESDAAGAKATVESVDLEMIIDEPAYNASFTYLSSPPYTNPVWDDLVQSGRNDYVPANTIVDIMNERNDPRRDDYFTPVSGDTYLGDEYGSGTSYNSVSHVADPLKDPTYPGMLLSASEVNFYLAEAAARGWNVGGAAADYYKEAVTQSILYYGGTTAEAEAYLGHPLVAFNPANWKELIATQSWLSFYNRGLVAWTQWRRLDAPTFNPPPDAEYSDIPVRFTYPVTEQNLNTANFEAAAAAIGGDAVTTKLFWDVK